MGSMKKGAALLLGLPPVGGNHVRRASTTGLGRLNRFVRGAFGCGLINRTNVAAVPPLSYRRGRPAMLEASSCRACFVGRRKAGGLVVGLG